jgi:hypothetical protein
MAELLQDYEWDLVVRLVGQHQSPEFTERVRASVPSPSRLSEAVTQIEALRIANPRGDGAERVNETLDRVLKILHRPHPNFDLPLDPPVFVDVPKCSGPYVQPCLTYAGDIPNLRLYQWCDACILQLSPDQLRTMVGDHDHWMICELARLRQIIEQLRPEGEQP